MKNFLVGNALDIIKDGAVDTLDSVKDGTRLAMNAAQKGTAKFHDKYVSKITPDFGKYGKQAEFIAGLAPGVDEYNALREGDWKGLAISAGIDVAAIGVGIATAGTGYAAAKGGVKAAKAGAKVITKKATKEVAEVTTKKVVKEVVEETTEKILKEGVEEATEKIAKEGTEHIIKEGSEKVIKEGSEKVLKEGSEKVIKEGSEKSLKEATEKTIKEGSEKTIREETENIGKQGAEKSLKEGVGKISQETIEKLKKDGMSEETIKKLEIDKDGLLKMKTINSELKGQKNAYGIEYVEKTIKSGGTKIKGVFPKFDSKYTYKLDNKYLRASDSEQFKQCTKGLKEALDKNPSLKKMFNERQLEQINDGAQKISGYVWHHNEETGVMQLVEEAIHQKSGHTGGRAIWGGGNINR